MNNTLYCLPYGQSMLPKFLEECNTNEYGYDEAVFVLSESNICAGLQVSAFSFDFLAKEILRLNGEHLSGISIFASKLLLKGLIAELHEKGQLSFFADFSSSNALCESVFALFDELEKSMITPENFFVGIQTMAVGGTLRAKDKELFALYYAYRQILQEQGLATEADIYLSASEILANSTLPNPFKKIYISGFYKFTAVQLDLIKQLSKSCEVDICLCYQKEDVYKASQQAFEDIIGLGFSSVFVDSWANGKNPILKQLDSNIFRFSDERIKADASVKIKRYANRRQEMQEVVADIKNKLLTGAKTDEILLCVRNLALYPGLKREFDIAGVPVCLSDMAKLSVQPSARLLDSVLQIAAGEVKQGLQSFFANFFVQKCFALDASKLRKTLDEFFFKDLQGAQAALGKIWESDSTFRDASEPIFAFLKSIPAHASAEKITNLLSAYLQTLPVVKTLGDLYGKGEIDCEELKLLADGHQKTLARLELLSKDFTLAGEASRELSVNEYRQMLSKYFQEASFLVKDADNNGVVVKSVDQAQEALYSYVYLLGLKEGEFPAFIDENWLYGDEERKNLQQVGVLPSSNTNAAEELFFFCSNIALAQKELWCSVSLADNEIMSIYLEEILRLLDAPQIEERRAGQILPPSHSIANEDMLACYLLAEKEAGCQWLSDYLGEEFICQTDSEQPWREDVFDGCLQQSAANVLIKQMLKFSFDASKLESYAFCPFMFLLEHVWQPVYWQQAVEDMRTNIKGTLYHECLKRFLAKYKAQPLLAKTFAQLLEELENVFAALVQEFLAKGWLQETYLSEQELSDMNACLADWLEAELEYQAKNAGDFYPCYFEWPFENFVLENDLGAFTVKGRIDRIDSDGDCYFVTDYKMKTTPKKADVSAGLDLQVPLYLLAVEKFLGQPLGGGYFSVENAKREGGFWLNAAKEKVSFSGRPLAGQKELEQNDWNEYKKLFLATINSLAEGISHGDFSPRPKGECPSYCLGQGICRVAQSKGTGLHDA